MWRDDDSDCQNTRAEVLVEESLVPVTFKNNDNCVVVSGSWIDPFTGQTHSHASKIDIDHMVPLKNAHDSGAAWWDAEDKQRFANDMARPETLAAVSASVNRSKGAQGPEAWKPANPEHWCDYARNWTRVKLRWNLTVTAAERDALSEMFALCN